MKKLLYKKIILLLMLPALAFLLFCLLPSKLEAENIIKLDSYDKSSNASSYLEILEDETRELSISEVSSRKYAGWFTPYTREEAPNYSYTDSVIWLHFLVDLAPEKQWIMEISYPLLNQIDLYISDGDGGFLHSQSGNLFPFNTRDIDHRNIIFSIPPSSQPQEIYLRVDTQSAMIIPVSIRELGDFIHIAEKEYIALGIYYGIIILVIFYFLLMYIQSRVSSYLYHIFYIVSVGLFLFTYNGLSFQYLWPDNPWWEQNSINFFIMLALFSAILFTYRLMPVKKHSPFFGKLLFAVGIIIICIAPLTFLINFTLAMRIGIFTVLASAVVVIPATGICWYKKYRPAGFILIGWIFLGIGVFIMSMRSLGVVADTFLTKYGVQIGFTIKIIFISIGLSDRMHILHMEKEKMEEKNRKLELDRQKLEHTEMLNRMCREISFHDDVVDIIRNLLLYIKKQVPYHCACFLQKKDGSFNVLVNFRRESWSLKRNKKAFVEDIFINCLDRKKPIIISGLRGRKPFKSYSVSRDSCSVMVAPIISLDKPLGVIILENNDRDFSMLDSSLVMNFVNHASRKIENAQLFQEVKMLSVKDELTGLYNRRYLYQQGEQEIKKARRYGSSLSLVMLDIDNFKNVNDTYGHIAGDNVLKKLASQCLKILRNIDIASRYGGEEFLFILPETGPSDANAVAERLRKKISSEPIQIEDNNIKITISVGIASLQNDIQNFDQLVANVDRALLAAKKSGKNISVVYPL
jgi:diguanylate cyclase (GGDEF)-like protein